MPKEKKKEFKIWGRVLDKGTGRALPDLTVKAFDKDLFFDDPLGTVKTDGNGYFEIFYSRKDFKDFIFDKKADIYIRIIDPGGKELVTTRSWVRHEARSEEGFIIRIPTKWPKKMPGRKAKEQEMEKVEIVSIALEELPGIGPGRAKKLRAEGIDDVHAFSNADEGKLKKILGNLDIRKMKKESKKLIDKTGKK